MKSKALVVFQNRAKHFEADLELIDLLTIAIANGSLPSGAYLYEHCDGSRHPVLSKRRKTIGSRNAAIRHLSATVRASYIKDLYEDFCAYLTAIIRSAAAKGLSTDRLIGDHSFVIEAKDLLALKNWDSVLERLSSDLFRKIEEIRDTLKTIKAFCRKLDLQVEPQVVQSALAFFQMRHLLVHADGLVDKEFAGRFPSFGWTSGEYVILTPDLILDANRSVSALVLAIDTQVVAKKIIRAQDTQP